MSNLPPGWEQRRLSDVAATQLGRMLSKSRETGEHALPYLRNRDVQWGHIDVANLPTMDFRPEEQVKFKLAPGDVLVCEGGEIGRAAVWKGQFPDCYYQKALHRVRTSDALSPEYLRYLLEHYARSKAFSDYTSGSTIAHLPQEDLRSLTIDLPPRAEQDRIVAAIEECFSRMDVAEEALEHVQIAVRRMRDAIRFAAVRGQLVSHDSSEETSASLINRVKPTGRFRGEASLPKDLAGIPEGWTWAPMGAWRAGSPSATSER